ncbi:MAG: FAD-dependent oxidoreductase, partial [Pseudomonadota bacterium]
MADRHIGIIGAGVAGLSAAQRLAQAGVSSTVVDKGSRPGGRCASRITPEGFQFDHGAQYASANGAAFGAFMAAAHAAGHAARWAPAEGDGRARYVAAPTMNAIAGA